MENRAKEIRACCYCGTFTSNGQFCPRCQQYDSRPAVVIQGELSEQYADEWREWQSRLPAAL